MNDPALRRNRTGHDWEPVSPAPGPISYAPLSANLIRAAAGQGYLSRADQERRARQVAHSFRQHVLVGITHHAEQQITVATLRPKNAASQGYDTGHQICVEANGNVSVLHHEDASLTADHLIARRVLLLLAGLTAAVGALGSFILL